MQTTNVLLLVLAIGITAGIACCACHCCCGGNGTDTPMSISAASVAITLLILLKAWALVVAGPTAVHEGFSAGVRSDSQPRTTQDCPMGAYDQLHLRTKCRDKWRHAPCDLPLSHPGRSAFLVQGHTAPDVTPPVSKPDHGPETPSVDGTQDAPKSKFMFAYNQCRPECCPSTYSCDHGCVCTTEQQRKFLQQRGKNHRAPCKT